MIEDRKYNKNENLPSRILSVNLVIVKMVGIDNVNRTLQKAASDVMDFKSLGRLLYSWAP